MCQVSLATLGVSKNVKFRLSRNSTKFTMVARLRETNSMARSVFHPRSRKIPDLQPKLPFYPFSGNLNFLGFYRKGLGLLDYFNVLGLNV